MTSCDENKTDFQQELPGTWLCFQNKIWTKQQKTWPILTTKRIGAQKTKARTTNHRSTEYVQGRQWKQSQQNCTPSCKKVGLTLTKISSFQKRRQKKKKERKKERRKERNMQTWRIRIHSSLQSEIFKVSLWWPFKKMLRNWKQKTDTSQTLKMMTAGQFIKLYYHKRIITAMNVCTRVSALPVLH